MRVAIITPTAFLNDFATRSNYQFVLAHVYKNDPVYREFYLKRAEAGDRIIVDNGAYEFSKSVDPQDIYDTVRELNAEVCVLPDARFQMKRTLEYTASAMERLRQTNAKLLGVPQGSNLEEVLECYDRLTAMGVDGYGLYEEIGEVTGLGNRTAFCQFLEDSGRVDGDKYYHLLGMEEDLTNIADLAKFLWVDGIDSCKAIVYGLSGIELTPAGTPFAYPHRPKNYFELQAVADAPLIQRNITQVLRWASLL